MPRLEISVPTDPDGRVAVQLAEWVLEARMRPPAGWDLGHSWLIGHPICPNRNRQVLCSLEKGADWLLLVDSDALPDMAGLRLLLEDALRPGVDIVAGWTVIGHPTIDLRPCVFHLPEHVIGVEQIEQVDRGLERGRRLGRAAQPFGEDRFDKNFARQGRAHRVAGHAYDRSRK